MNKELLFGIIFFSVMAIVGYLCYGEGVWDGMKEMCPEPNMLVVDRTDKILCYTPEMIQIQEDELAKLDINNWHMEDWDGFKT